MADNTRWVVDRERGRGRVLLFAHAWHVKKATALKEPYGEFFSGKAITPMGQYLHSMLGDAMVVFELAFQQDEERSLAPPERGSLEAGLADVALPLFGLDLRRAPSGPVAEWLHQGRQVRDNDRYGQLVPSSAFDAVIFFQNISSGHPVQ
jgi:erythromycin esterase-like protein